jgi:NTE family protein
MWNPFRGPNTTLALALQGGGAHGAFTWGVLDALLERVALPLAALSGTSAGAINALLLAHGLLEGGRDGARGSLSKFWTSLGRSLPLDVWGLLDGDGERLTAPAQWMLHWSQFVSPYQVNPLGINPLRDALRAQIDFERLAAQRELSLFIAATHANTGWHRPACR